MQQGCPVHSTDYTAIVCTPPAPLQSSLHEHERLALALRPRVACSPSCVASCTVMSLDTAASSATASGRIRRKRKSDRLSSSATPAFALSSISSSAAADVWGEVEEQIERTLREHRTGEEGDVRCPPPQPPPSFSPLSHSRSLPLLSAGSPYSLSPDLSDASTALSPSLSLSSFSPSSAHSPSSPSWPSSAAALGPHPLYPDSRQLLDPSRLHALVRQRTEGRLSALTALNADVLLRCLGFLELSELCCVASVSRAFLELSEDWSMWAELFACRWPVQRAREEGKERWKAEYRARELQERSAFFLSLAHQPSGDSAEWRSLYAAQRTRERRRRRSVSELDPIRRWKDSHAPDDAAPHGSACSFTRCRLVQLTAELYICAASHAVHHCDHNCLHREGESDGRCPVSGRWPSGLDTSMLAIAEAEGDEHDEAQDAFELDGLLPSAFIRGYEDGDGAWAGADEGGADGRREDGDEDAEDDSPPDCTALQRTRRLASAERRRRRARLVYHTQ